MKKETFQRARLIDAEIDSLNFAISTIDEKGHSGVQVKMLISVIDQGSGLQDRMEQKVKAEAVKIFKAEIARLQKEFDALK
ncbi:MAG TPA: hypothetical protein PLD84_16460 [Chitinophagales bacterium]|nr:hypothetical protein [Chitinophagales bacterium]